MCSTATQQGCWAGLLEPGLLLLKGPRERIYHKAGCLRQKIIKLGELTHIFCFLFLYKKRVTHASCEVQLLPETRTQESFPSSCLDSHPPPSLFLFSYCNFRGDKKWKWFSHCSTRSFLLLPATSIIPCYFLIFLLPQWGLMELLNDNKPSLQ